MFQWLDNLEAKYLSTWKGKLMLLVGYVALCWIYGFIDKFFIKGTKLEIWKENASLIFYWFIIFFVYWGIFYELSGAKNKRVNFWKVGFLLFGCFLLIRTSGYFLHGTPLNPSGTVWALVSTALAFLFTMWGIYKKFIVSKGRDLKRRDVVFVVLCAVLLVPPFLTMLNVLYVYSLSN